MRAITFEHGAVLADGGHVDRRPEEPGKTRRGCNSQLAGVAPRLRIIGANKMIFEKWFSKHEWRNEKYRRRDLGTEWALLKMRGVPEETIAGVFDVIVQAMRNEYAE